MANKDLVLENGTRRMHYLTGDRDHDLFLEPQDMTTPSHWELLMGCHHQGQCDEDVQEAARYFDFEGSSDKAYEYLIECGIEAETFEDTDDEFTTGRNEDKVLQYYLWMLAGDIQEYFPELCEEEN